MVGLVLDFFGNNLANENQLRLARSPLKMGHQLRLRFFQEMLLVFWIRASISVERIAMVGEEGERKAKKMGVGLPEGG